MEQFNKPRELFRSEEYFLEKIMRFGLSILDVGCGTGALYHALKNKYADLKYVGIDIAENMLNRARELNPDCRWVEGNFLDDGLLDSDLMFDLTFATGVFQHEPQTEKLLTNMLKRTKCGGYSLFDVKLFHTHNTLCDNAQAYCDLDDRLYFVVFCLNDLLRLLLSHDDVIGIKIYGYYVGTNESVRLPADLREPVCSAHILLIKGKREKDIPTSIDINLPADFILNYKKKVCKD